MSGSTFKQGQLVKIDHQRLILLFVVMGVVASPPRAAEFSLQPYVSLYGIASDNILLSSTNKEDEYIAQFIPGVSIVNRGRGLQLDVDYAKEMLAYARDSGRNTSYDRLQATAVAEISRDTLFLDAAGSIRQQVINNRSRLIVDNLNPALRTNITTYVVGPRMESRIGELASSTVSLKTGRVLYDNTTQLTDSDITLIKARLQSGKSFAVSQWHVTYDFNETRRSAGDRTKLESLTGSAQSRITRRLNWVVNAGFINDDIQVIQALRTGFYYSAGLAWRPNERTFISATYGNNNEDLVAEYSVSQRTSLRVSYRNRKFGANPGDRWDVSLKGGNRRTEWSLSYAEDTTNLQVVDFLTAGTTSLVNVGGTGVNLFALTFSPTDEDFIRKILRWNISMTRARSRFDIGFGGEHREFLDAGKTDKFYDGNVQWVLQLTGHSSLTMNLGFINRHFSFAGTGDDNRFAGLVFNRSLGARANVSLTYRLLSRDGAGSAGDYEENRVTVGFNAAF